MVKLEFVISDGGSVTKVEGKLYGSGTIVEQVTAFAIMEVARRFMAHMEEDNSSMLYGGFTVREQIHRASREIAKMLGTGLSDCEGEQYGL